MVLWILLGLLAVVILLSGSSLFTKLLYGKAVFTDTSSEALRAAEETLKAADIPYSVDTVRRTPNYMQGMNTAAYAKSGLSDSNIRAQNTPTYFLYVRRSRYQAATDALHPKKSEQQP